MTTTAKISIILVDAAAVEDLALQFAKRVSMRWDCLYKGEARKNLAEVAPYMFLVPGAFDLKQPLVADHWGRSCCCHLTAHADFESIHSHLRKFLIVKTEQGEELYFRYYDPRVLRLVLPTFTAQQLQEFFGPIQEIVVEDENPAFALRYWLDHSKLNIRREPTVERRGA